jgi:hypothetical protein
LQADAVAIDTNPTIARTSRHFKGIGEVRMSLRDDFCARHFHSGVSETEDVSSVKQSHAVPTLNTNPTPAPGTKGCFNAGDKERIR